MTNIISICISYKKQRTSDQSLFTLGMELNHRMRKIYYASCNRVVVSRKRSECLPFLYRFDILQDRVDHIGRLVVASNVHGLNRWRDWIKRGGKQNSHEFCRLSRSCTEHPKSSWHVQSVPGNSANRPRHEWMQLDWQCLFQPDQSLNKQTTNNRNTL